MNTSVFVCDDGPPLAVTTPGVVTIEGLCRDPGLLRDWGSGADRAVVVLHRDSYDLPAVQRALRSINIDPLGAQVLSVGHNDDPGVLPYQIEGLKQRAGAFTGTAPEHAKPVFSRTATRRGFLRPPTPAYVAAPRVDSSTCVAGDGCSTCVDICPQGAYQWSDGRISYDKDACVPCGRCVTSCPVGAIENPAATPAMIDAQVRASVDASDGSVGIRFVCSRGSVMAEAGWADISVPCTSMIPSSWYVACRLLGASCAKAVSCGDCGCPVGGDSLVIEAHDIAQRMLTQSGFEVLAITGGLHDNKGDLAGINPFDLKSTTDVILMLAAWTGTDFTVESEHAQHGIVSIDRAACTLCGQCAKVCPTNALGETYADDIISISFDAMVCVNCSQCVAQCPEIDRDAISVRGLIDTDRLKVGRDVLNEGTIARCESCGAAFAPAAMMDRIAALLGDEFQKTVRLLETRCLDCRGR